MAYKMSTLFSCFWRGCEKQASFQVFNTYNSPQGFYCLKHAELTVTELNKKEAGDGEKEKA